ncbi:XdhC family protein [Algoriphagus boritolerans]|uniref:Xanthine and CO dehydrogenase maturation factor, XdhC/CoxF family n=1 Tax=Algoriphagus boritolerans DSM 17298 = JCM 18970 TaxID=1120964 RepID=A0A1H5XLP2_9BACT|nr:XdhC/CoxI family protein [Algoriphagus boritolerans]SEG12330.1 Xanthine and CO dehydrogenase maturation factor, XdhC/CoxF family [Algoriphagus boritolerans DSM 17298 = JCM 18970]
MKELQQIIQAYEVCKSENKSVALATVVQVDGSAYRRPGARMLVTQEGNLTGAISGGCLEGDALRKAQAVIFQQKSMLVTYDTTDEDDQKFGVGLGCNGIIHVLIEPIDFRIPDNPVELIKKSLSDRQTSLLLTLFSVPNSKSEQLGTIYLKKGNQDFGSLSKVHADFRQVLEKEIAEFDAPQNLIKSFSEYQQLSVFFEVIKPATRILLFGAGNDTIPVAKMAEILGFELILIDGRKNLATTARFPFAKQIIQGPAEEVTNQIETDLNTVALLMTHNFEYEVIVLEKLLTFMIPYIGILGPKRKTEKLTQRLETKGIQVHSDNIYAPVGIEIGAETSEEIALSILAEIKAVLNKKQPIFLREKLGPIHEKI